MRSRRDPRPESFHPADMKQVVATGHMATADCWGERRCLLLGRARVHPRLQIIIEGAKGNEMSLAVFKPTRIKDCVWERAYMWKEETFGPKGTFGGQSDLRDAVLTRDLCVLVKRLHPSFSPTSFTPLST